MGRELGLIFSEFLKIPQDLVVSAAGEPQGTGELKW